MEINEPDWGMHINRYDHDPQSPSATDWLSIKGQNIWKWRGLIVWRREPEQIVSIQPGYTMKIIKELQKSTKWQREGYIIGEWGMSFEFNLKTKESKSSEPGLLNQMHLTPEQSGELLSFLMTNIKELQQLYSEDSLKYKAGMRALLDILYELREEDENKLASEPSSFLKQKSPDLNKSSPAVK